MAPEIGISNTIPFQMNVRAISGSSAFEYTAIDNSFSMEFDGANSYFNAGTELFTDSTISAISISCWIKSTVGSANAIVSKDLATSGNRNFLFQIASGNLYWQHSTNGSGFSNLIVNQSTYNVIDGNWHHIVVTFEAGSTSGTAEKKIYIDGEVRATDPAATLVNIFNTTSVPIEIGRRGDGTRYFNGNLDEIAVFASKLSDTTIQAIYNATANNPGKVADLSETPEGVPTAWYRMGD